MKHAMSKSLALAALGLATAGSWAGAQTVNRDVKVTGPRGRTIERQIHTQRGPGYAERDITIRRPGGTVERDVRVQRGGGGGGFVPGPGPRGPRNVIIERDYYVAPPPPPPLFGFGFGGPLFNFGFSSAPPPVVVAPAPVIVEPAPPPTVVYQPPVRYTTPPAQQTIVADPVAAAMDRLRSYHNHSRRDGALTLGRLGDARAVPALVERLDKDNEKEVRVAAAWALGEIGDPRGALSLQKASLYDRKQDVRDAASIAYRKLDRREAPVVQAPASTSSLPAASPGEEEPQPLPNRSLEPPPPEPMPDYPR